MSDESEKRGYRTNLTQRQAPRSSTTGVLAANGKRHHSGRSLYPALFKYRNNLYWNLHCFLRPTMPSVANTQFSRRFRNHLTTNTLPFQQLTQHPKIHLPHCETWSFALRNMPNLTSEHAQSRLERWPIATRKMPNGKLRSRFLVAHLVKSAFSCAISRKIIYQLFHQKAGQTPLRFATVSSPVAHGPTLRAQPIAAK